MTDEGCTMDKLLKMKLHKHPWPIRDDNRPKLDHIEDQENEMMDNHEDDDLATER